MSAHQRSRSSPTAGVGAFGSAWGNLFGGGHGGRSGGGGDGSGLVKGPNSATSAEGPPVGLTSLASYAPASPGSPGLRSPRKALRANFEVPGDGRYQLVHHWQAEYLYTTELRSPSELPAAGQAPAGPSRRGTSVLSRLTSFASSGAGIVGLGGGGGGGGGGGNAHAGSSGATAEGSQPHGSRYGGDGLANARHVSYGWGTRGTQACVVLVRRCLLEMLLMNAELERSAQAESTRDWRGRSLSGGVDLATAPKSARGVDELRQASTTPPPPAVTSAPPRERRGLFGRRRAASVKTESSTVASSRADGAADAAAAGRPKIAPELLALGSSRAATGMSSGHTDALGAYGLRGQRSAQRGAAGSPPTASRINRGRTLLDNTSEAMADAEVAASDGDRRADTIETTSAGDLNVPLVSLNYRDQLYVVRGDETSAVLQKMRFRVLPTCHRLFLLPDRDVLVLVVGFANGDILVHRNPLGSADDGYRCVSAPPELTSKADGAKHLMVTCLTVTPHGGHLLAGHGNGMVFCHELGLDATTTAAASANFRCVVALSSGMAITSLALAGDRLACTCRDGSLRILAWPGAASGPARCVASLSSHYGAVLCAAWSPDAHYLATGGEDDLVMIWRVMSNKEAATATCMLHGVGHSSFVTALEWEQPPSPPPTDEVPAVQLPKSTTAGTYRLFSVGQDAKLCVWDLAMDTLPPARKGKRGLLPPEITPVLQQHVHHDGLNTIWCREVDDALTLVTADEAGSVRMWQQRRRAHQADQSDGFDVEMAGSPSASLPRIDYLLSALSDRSP
ncbi:hypothetical protein CDCA_CDCA10G2857 [Cyanidium caldarium]|uniref:Uncharacterized protein n=1 Tax=Cyanidium caldarium TaxID=2771 RepID=A0AAV9IX05_CYACA|nr:hypothetical protein CDCA_CDCA10G2857 [Cyanidium caldarium]